MDTAATMNAEPSVPAERTKSYLDTAEQNLVSHPDSPPLTDQSTPELYAGQGQDATPRSPRRNIHKKSASLRVNGFSKDSKGPSVVVERYEDKDGEHLVSIRDAWDGQTSKTRRNSELVSGRKAGAGWEQSQYAAQYSSNVYKTRQPVNYVFSVHFAPLSVPLKRRLQTLVVLAHTLSIAFLLSLFFLLCAIPIFWPILLPYLIYVLFSSAGYSGTLSHRSDFIRSLRIWSLFASYFPARLHRSAVLPPTRKYVFGYHPHGIISHGAFAAFATEALGFSQLFPGITNTLLTLDSNFRVPLYREYALTMGLQSVSRESCENILSRGGPNGEGMGRGITIVVGGARESLDAQPHSLRLVLRRRKGFVKLAIRTGADLVPVLAFGENELYDQVQPEQHPLIHKFQLVVKTVLGFTVPLFHARGIFNYDVGLLPYRRPLNIVVGRPIKVHLTSKPSESYIDELHDVYVKELERIWEEWKDEFAMERTSELQIVE